MVSFRTLISSLALAASSMLLAAQVSAQDCGSTNPSSPCTSSRISTVVDGITFAWSVSCTGGACQAGRFLDGSPWVRNPTGGAVVISSVTPDDSGDGFEKNPATGTRAKSRAQGLLQCANGEAPYDASLDLSTKLPYSA